MWSIIEDRYTLSTIRIQSVMRDAKAVSSAQKHTCRWQAKSIT